MGEYNSNMEGGARRGEKYPFSDSGGTRYCLSQKRILVSGYCKKGRCFGKEKKVMHESTLYQVHWIRMWGKGTIDLLHTPHQSVLPLLCAG
jgi:hypothetical protein